MEAQLPPHPWSGRRMCWQIDVRDREASDGYVAVLSWTDDGEVLATAEAVQPADCIAAVSAALTSITGRAQLSSNLRRGLEDIVGEDAD